MVAAPRVPQLVVPFSTSPFTAILFAGTDEFTELLEEETTDDDAIDDETIDEEIADEEITDDDTTDDETTEEEIADDEITDEEIFEDETIDDETTTLLLEREDETTCELLPPTIPHGAGCAAHVEREIQLLLFS